MIDFISIEVKNFSSWNLLDHPRLSWKTTVSNETGEVLNYYTEWNKLFFKITQFDKPRLLIRNSLHIFSQGSNYQDYNFNELRSTLCFLQREIGFSLNGANVHALEIGVNIETPIPPKEIFKNYLQYKTTLFQPMRGKGKMFGIECDMSQFKIKVYDKGKQYKLENNLMRFEVRVKKMQYLNRTYKIHLYSIQDLLNKDIFKDLERVLLSVYSSILKLENLPIEVLKLRDRELLLSGRSQAYWTGWREFNRNTYNSKLKRFNELQDQYKQDSVHDKVRELIVSKWRELLQPNLGKTSHKVTILEGVPNQKSNISFHTKLPLVHRVTLCETQIDRLRNLTTSQRVLFNQRKCVICEQDISHKRRDAKTCSKKCRNKKSNLYQNKLRKLKKEISIPSLVY